MNGNEPMNVTPSAATYLYAEAGIRYLMYQPTPEFDDYGCNDRGEQWAHSFCVMDDFGCAVPVAGFAYADEGYVPYLGPDMDSATPVGQAYKYILYTQMPH